MSYTAMTKLMPLAVLIVLFAAACSELPTVTNSDGVADTPDAVVSLCYTGQNTTVDELRRMALSYCPEGTTRVDAWEHDTFFNDCPVSKKNRVTFRCLAQ